MQGDKGARETAGNDNVIPQHRNSSSCSRFLLRLPGCGGHSGNYLGLLNVAIATGAGSGSWHSNRDQGEIW